jgi:hypothetical protein
MIPLISYLIYSSALKILAISSSETSGSLPAGRHYNSEHGAVFVFKPVRISKPIRINIFGCSVHDDK